MNRSNKKLQLYLTRLRHKHTCILKFQVFVFQKKTNEVQIKTAAEKNKGTVLRNFNDIF